MTEMTKKALALSLKKLLEKKPLSKITVTDIAAECGINRHTFYYHFRDIYDLLEWIYVSETEEYILREGVPANWQESLTRLFQYCLENKKFVVTTYVFFQKDNMFQFIHKHAALIVGRDYRIRYGKCGDFPRKTGILLWIFMHTLWKGSSMAGSKTE